MHRFLKTFSFILIFASSTLIHAAPYAGLGVSRVDGYAEDGSDVGDANGITVYGGDKFTDYLGYEISYNDVGDIDVPSTSLIITGSLLKAQATFSSDLSDTVWPMLKLGVVLPDLKDNSFYTYDDAEVVVTIGINVQFSKNLGFRAEYEQFKELGALNLNILSFSMYTRFD